MALEENKHDLFAYTFTSNELMARKADHFSNIQ